MAAAAAADVEQRARAKKRSLQLAARNNCAAFVEYVLRHERTGARLHNAPFHREWHAHFDENDYAVLIAPVEHAKTQQISVGRVLFEMGRDHNARVALISGSAGLAKKPLKTVRQYIERSRPLREVFPTLAPSQRDSDPWRDEQITVARTSMAKDPTCQALGAFGKIVGSRLDLVICDDILTFENTRTLEQRNKLREWFDTEVITRLTDGARIYVVGTPWHPEDLLHELAKRPGFAARTYSAVANPDDRPEKWRPLWPQQWSWQRLQKRRDNMVERDFARKYLCRVRLDATARFKLAWFAKCAALGRGLRMEPVAPRLGNGSELPCFAGVDLAIGKQGERANKRRAESVIFVVALLPDGRRRPLEVEGGRWTGPEIVDRLYSVYKRYGCELYVESNGAQEFLVQFARLQEMRGAVHSFHTGSNKWGPWGVESLAVEFRNAQWVLPCDDEGNMASPGLARFVSDCLYFDPASHTGDYLMAAWMARQALIDFSGERSQHVNLQAR